MNTKIYFLAILLAVTTFEIRADSPEPTVADRGAHHRVWQRILERVGPDGKAIKQTNSYVELATGLHYQKDGQWLESKEEIELFEGGAVARHGQHQVIFTANINTAGTIDLVSVDGKRFRSHILGLAYTDTATGNAAMIAEVKDSIGQLVAPNQIIYFDAFTDFKADIQYTYTKSGFEQDVILRQEPISPAAYGLNPDTTILEIYTEFLEPPVPAKTVTVINKDTVDEGLNFGAMFIGSGNGFSLDGDNEQDQVPIYKTWEQREGRHFLIERVEYQAIQPHLINLPKAAALKKENQNAGLVAKAQDPRKDLLARFSAPPVRPKGSSSPMQMASISKKEKGFVLDYQQLNADTNNFTFKSDTTYFISAPVILTGSNILEGGTVIKATNGTTPKRIRIQGSLDCRTSAYRPAIFTGKDDNAVGEIISGSTTNPTTNYYGQYLELGTNVYDLHDVHLQYPYYGIGLSGNPQVTISNVQICRFNAAVLPGSGVVKLRNALIYDGTYAIAAGAAGSYFENVTFHRLANLRSGAYTTTATNCLIIAATNNVTLSGVSNYYTNIDQAGIFQTVGAASHYLATNSPHRNAGTTNINPGLLAALKTRTTYPPTVLTNNLTASTNFMPQAQRDTDLPDLGYHYDPLDFVLNKIALTNATLTIMPGTAIGIYGTDYGLWLHDGANLICEGAAENFCHIVRYNLVQEQANTNWSSVGVGMSIKSLADNWLASPEPAAHFRFTDFAMPAYGGYHFWIPWAMMTNVVFQDCQLLGGALYFDLPPVAFTNSLFERVALEVHGNSGAEYHNNLFYGGSLIFDGGAGLHTFTDNLFHEIAITQYGGASNSHNGYWYPTNLTTLSPTNTNNVVLTNITYEIGSLGRYYLPTNSPLINMGSMTNAASIGLFHYTTTTNQVKEGTSRVDIGFHYVATTNGLPIDSDNDGIPDYAEDANGNGLTDTGETCFHDPRLTIASTMDYIKGSPPKLLDTNAVVSDSYSLDFGGGQLIVSITAGVDPLDQLSIRNQGTNASQIGVSGTNVTYSATNIATFVGGLGTNALVVSFNTNAAVEIVQALVRNLTFCNTSNNPVSSTRSLKFTLTDGDGGTNVPVYQTINIICPAAIDLMLVLDISQSMTNPNPNLFVEAKQAASNFVSFLDFPPDRVGLISFAGYAYTNAPLTNDGPGVQSLIMGLTITNGTRFHPAFESVLWAFTNQAQTATNVLRAMILLSDGKVGHITGTGTVEEQYTNRVEATNWCLKIKDAGIRVISVAFGDGGPPAGTNMMQWFASSPSDYYYATNASHISSNLMAIVPGLCRTNAAPAISIITPTNGQTFLAPADISISATASDPDGTVTNVAFYYGSTKLADDANAPFTFAWTNVLGSNYALTAVAKDNNGFSATSGVVNVTVQKRPPEISILSPANNTTNAAPGVFEIKTNPKDYDGTVTNVQFFQGSTSLGNVTNLPFHFTWTNVSAGTYTLKAVATDNDNLSTTSAPVAVAVTTCSSVGLYSLTPTNITLFGGLSATGTVTISTSAPPGGQAVSLFCASPIVSIPASVLIPQGQTNISFRIETRTVTSQQNTEVFVSLYGFNVPMTLTVQATNFQTSGTFRGQCGPMDVAFIVTYSDPLCDCADPPTALEHIQVALSNSIDIIAFASGGDYRLALVGVTNAAFDIFTEFAPTNRESFLIGLSSLVCEGYGTPEPSDEALNMVINNLTDDNRPMQRGDFTNGFRADVHKIIVLIAPGPPMSYTNDFYPGIDDVNAHWRAVEAWTKNIQICAIMWERHDFQKDEFAPSIMQDYALTTGGMYAHAGRCATNIGIYLPRMLSQCGADVGEVIFVRDDNRQVAYAGITLNDAQRGAAARDFAAFNTTGIDGEIVAARVRRSGQLRVNYGSRFDLQMGVASLQDSNSTSYGIVLTNADTIPVGTAYDHEWELPFSFYLELQLAHGNTYSVKLTDRASAACGNSFEIIDLPGADFPTRRNTLLFKTLRPLQIPQGRCRDFVLPGTIGPSTTNETWEISLWGRVIASSCASEGWSVESDYTAYAGINIGVPTNAPVAKQYDVKYRDAQDASHSGFFEVVAVGTLNSAPVLLPLEISPAIRRTNSPVNVTVKLDAPAPANGAVVSLNSAGITNGLPAYVVIPAGETQNTVAFRTPSSVQSNSNYEITASYNGIRKASILVVDEAGGPPTAPANLQTYADVHRILIRWDMVPNALYYRIERSTDCFNAVTIADRVTDTCYVDNTVGGGTNNCYRVWAINSYPESNSACACAQALDPLLRPVISPPGGKFYDSVSVTITNLTSGATIYYTTNGISPTNTSPVLYTNQPLVFTTNTILIAMASNGVWSAEAKRDFVINTPRPFSCNSTSILSLAATNWPSPVHEIPLPCERFLFSGVVGEKVTIKVSAEFDPVLTLIDPAGQVVAQTETYTPQHAKIVYIPKTNGTFVIDLVPRPYGTSYEGAFSISRICESVPKLAVLVDGASISNSSTVDLGITPTNVLISKVITITNWGTTNLNITGLTANPSPYFSVSPTNLSAIPPGGSNNITVSFNSSAVGFFNGTFYFYSDDEDFVEPGFDTLLPFVIYFSARANPAGVPPTITITNPPNGQWFTSPTNVTISANATATNTTTVTNVDFYVISATATNLIGSDTTSPYSVVWGNNSGGNYKLRAVVTDGAGRVGLPSSVNVAFNRRPMPKKDFLPVWTASGLNQLDVLANDTDPDHDPLSVIAIAGNTTNGIASTNNGMVFYTPTNSSGSDSFTYTVSDGRGGTAVTNVSVVILNTVYEYDQTATISYPTNDTEITAPVDVIGTVDSPYLQYYELQYRRRSAVPSPWKTFADGNLEVTTNYLGTFDPTGLPNGIYEINLKAVDWVDGATVEYGPVIVQVGEGFKVGHFTVAFNDLQIPVSGLPITLTRTYDSRDSSAGEFGAGWQLDIRAARLEKDGVLGAGWRAVISGFGGLERCIVPGEAHLVTITFPNDQKFRFSAELGVNNTGEPCTLANGVSSAHAQMIFKPLPGTTGTLTPLHHPGNLDINALDTNNVTLHEDRGNISILGPIFDPAEFVLTTLDGRQFQFNADGKLVKMTDRNTNTLSFGEDGIIHSSGKSVKVVRDTTGRISQIYDPNGLDGAGQTSGPPTVAYYYDPLGNLIDVARLTDRASSNYLVTEFIYDSPQHPNYLTAIKDPRGITGIRNEYDENGRLTNSIDAAGKSISYIHDISGKKEIIVDRLGNANTFSYDAKGNVTNSVNALGHTNVFAYDANGNLLTHTDPLGNTTTNTYDVNGNLLSVTFPHKPGEDSAKFTTRYTYDAFGEQTSITLPTGAIITNNIDVTTGNLLSVLAGTNVVERFTYNANGNATAEIDRFGTNKFGYDVFGNATHFTNSLGQVITSGYDANGNLTNLVDSGVASSFRYDALGREAFSDYGNGITLSNSYVSDLDWHTVDGATIGHMERKFDDQGRLGGWVTPSGATPAFGYDANGRLLYETNSLGQVTHHTYDAAGRAVAVTNMATGASTSYDYDAAGRRLAETNALGHVTRYAFNPDDSLAAMTNAFGTNAWLYSYEVGGSCCGGSGGGSTIVTDPLGRVTENIQTPYSLPSQIIRRASAGGTGANAATNTTTYLSGLATPEQEAEQYPVTITDEGGRTRHYAYTELGQLSRATDLSGSIWWTNQYDSSSGALTNVVSPTGETLSYGYDNLDNLKTIRFGDGNYLTNYYNAENRLASNTLPSGATMALKYDFAGRLTNRTSTIGETASFQYNNNDAITRMSDNTGMTTNLYDAAGRLFGIDYPSGAIVRYELDLLNRITVITNKASSGGATYVIRYKYDAIGNVTNVVDPWGSQTRLEYDRVGRRTKRTLSNGVVSEWQYNWKDQVTNITHKIGGTTLASVTYERAPGGEPTKITREDSTYVMLAYDAALRLTNEVYYSSGSTPQATNSYGYDAAGTRIRLVTAGVTYTNSVSAGYRVTQVKTNGSVAETYDYDSGGRVTNIMRSGITLKLGYNTADQVIAVTNGATWVKYVHDASGRRTVSTNSAGTVRRLLVAPTPGTDLESPHLIATAGGTLRQHYLYLKDQPLLRHDGSSFNRVYYLEDAMGTIIGLAPDSSPSMANTTRLFYDGFGNARATNGPAPTVPTGTGGDFRFHGAWLEADSGLYNMRAREYDARIGRFTSKDPDGGGTDNPESLHPYSFANNNPLIFSDPSGEFTLIEINIVGLKQSSFAALRQIVISSVKRKISDAAFEAVANLAVEQLGVIYPPLGEIWKTIKKEGRAEAGRMLENELKKKLCGAIGISPASKYFWFYPGIRRSGRAEFNGVNCPDLTLPKYEPARFYPDFVISEVPPAETSKQLPTGKAILIGDVKLSGNSLYNQYVNKKSRHYKPGQFDAISRYAGQHTYTRTAVFLTAFTGHKSNLEQVRVLLAKDGLKKGVIVVVIAASNTKGGGF